MTHYRFHLIDNKRFDVHLDTSDNAVFKVFSDDSSYIRVKDQHEGGPQFMMEKSRIIAIEVISSDNDAE